MMINMGCAGWDIDWQDPPMLSEHKREPIKTDFPVLFLSGHHDPVTPLQAALNMTRKFAGASIVEQKSEGHCTLACTSLCTIKHIRAYLNEGKLPPSPKFDGPYSGEWTTCECRQEPWNRQHNQPSESSLRGAGPHNQQQNDDPLRGRTIEETEWMRGWNDVSGVFASQFMNTQFGGQQSFSKVDVGFSVQDFGRRQSQCKT
jgi:hypothetical protein